MTTTQTETKEWTNIDFTYTTAYCTVKAYNKDIGRKERVIK